MARAYAAFANGGYRIDGSLFGDEPRAVECVADADGKTRREQRPSARPCPGFTGSNAAIETSCCRASSRTAPARRRSCPGWPVAGKTGTTENYGDAWFVGYTPDLVTAVWVGYPDELRPMLTEYHGKPVVGGTYPALIWKAFMEKALAVPQARRRRRSRRRVDPLRVAGDASLFRDRKLELDNGNCRGATIVQFFTGAGADDDRGLQAERGRRARTSIGVTLDDRRRRTCSASRCCPRCVYKPAQPGQRLGVVIGQIPRSGTLSAYDKVKLVVATGRCTASSRGWSACRSQARARSSRG